MRALTFVLFCWLLSIPLLHAQHDQVSSDDSSASVVRLAAELARIASRLAGAAPGRHRRHNYPYKEGHEAAPLHGTEAAVQDIKKGRVQSVPVAFKGHNLTVVALTTDEYVGGHILRTKTPYQKELLGPLMDAVRPGSVVVDAGANMGDFTVFLAAATGPSGVVYAFEPQARMFQLVCTNMIVNSLFQIQPMRNALSYEPGVLHMQATVTDGSSGGQSYKDVDKKDNAYINYGGMRLGLGGEAVQAITLDSLNLTDVSVIKVDIQGAEKRMFYGAQETIRRNLPVVAYEIMPAGLAMAVALDKELTLPKQVQDFNIEAFFKSLGYTMQSTGEDAIMWPPGKQPPAEGAGRRLLGPLQRRQ